MKCPRCQQEKPPQAKFCLECGAPFKVRQERGASAVSSVDLHRALSDALEQQAATSEILRVISMSQADVQPAFDTIVANAVNLCAARMGAVYRFDGQLLHLVAHHNYPPEVLRILQEMHPRAPQLDQASGRAVLTRAVAQIEDMLADPLYPHRRAAPGSLGRSLARSGIASCPLVATGSLQ